MKENKVLKWNDKLWNLPLLVQFVLGWGVAFLIWFIMIQLLLDEGKFAPEQMRRLYLGCVIVAGLFGLLWMSIVYVINDSDKIYKKINSFKEPINNEMDIEKLKELGKEMRKFASKKIALRPHAEALRIVYQALVVKIETLEKIKDVI